MQIDDVHLRSRCITGPTHLWIGTGTGSNTDQRFSYIMIREKSCRLLLFLGIVIVFKMFKIVIVFFVELLSLL